MSWDTFSKILGIGGSVAGTIIGANAAGNAADLQANAATNAATLQKQAADNALGFQRDVFNTGLSTQWPFIQAGQGGISNLAYLMGIPMNGGGPPQIGGGGSTGGAATAQNGNLGPLISMLNGGSMTNGGSKVGQFSSDPSDLLSTFAKENAMPGDEISPGARGPLNPSMMQDGSDALLNGGMPVSHTNLTGPDANPGMNNLNLLANGGNNTAINPALGGFGSLMQGFGEQFQAPTDVTEQNDPGYKFRLDQGEKALANSAAAKGGLLSGGTAKGMQRYGQDYASNEYGNVYNRAMGEYQNRYNIYNNNQTNQFNRLAALSGLGQTSTTNLNANLTSGANNTANILMNSANNIGSQLNNAAYQRGSGYAAQGNIIGSGISNIAQIIAMLGGKSGGAPTAGSLGYPDTPQ